MDTDQQNKSLIRIKMLHVSTSIRRFWPDMVHLEIQDKRGGWCRSLRWAAFMYTFVLIASSWLCILSTHVKKKCCYQSTAWRTQCRSILKKKVLKQRLKKHMHERSKVKCLAAQWGDYFFLHVCMYVCMFVSMDATRHITALHRSKVQLTFPCTAASFSISQK